MGRAKVEQGKGAGVLEQWAEQLASDRNGLRNVSEPEQQEGRRGHAAVRLAGSPS